VQVFIYDTVCLEIVYMSTLFVDFALFLFHHSYFFFFFFSVRLLSVLRGMTKIRIGDFRRIGDYLFHFTLYLMLFKEVRMKKY